jgi:GAF domain-containing protein
MNMRFVLRDRLLTVVRDRLLTVVRNRLLTVVSSRQIQTARLSFKATSLCWPMSSRVFPATSTHSSVPYDAASVILTEGDCLYVARTSAKTVQMLEGQRNTFLERVRVARKSVFVPDTAREADWEDVGILKEVRCWICVPLIASTERPASERVLGLLSVAHSLPSVFTQEHFRVVQSLAISAAVAIQNARLYERAEIYAAELEAMIGKQGQWQTRNAKADA